jgi:hypothetical protein
MFPLDFHLFLKLNALALRRHRLADCGDNLALVSSGISQRLCHRLQRCFTPSYFHSGDSPSVAHQLQHSAGCPVLFDQDQGARASLRCGTGTTTPEQTGLPRHAMWPSHVPCRFDPCIKVPSGPQLLCPCLEQDLRLEYRRNQPERVDVS